MVALARNPLHDYLPRTPAHFGVIFTQQGYYDLARELPKLRPKTLAVAIIQVLEYEEHFGKGASGHIIHIPSVQEVYFSREYPYDLLTHSHLAS
jgi:hypothetical protein